jgi:hypothetical protein
LAVVQGAIALRWPQPDHSAARIVLPLLLALAYAGTARAVGALAPLHGRRARLGQLTGQVGLALLALEAVVLAGGVEVLALRVSGVVLAVAGLRLLTRVRRDAELPFWAAAAVLVGVVVAMVFPLAGGALALGLAWLAVAAAIHTTQVAFERLTPRPSI